MRRRDWQNGNVEMQEEIISTEESSQRAYQEPKRRFETAGTTVPEDNYYVERKEVVSAEGENIMDVIKHHRFFTISAPRQTGKTTLIHEICEKLNQKDDHMAIHLDFQGFEDESFFELQELFEHFQLQFFQKLHSMLEIKNEETAARFLAFNESSKITSFHRFYLYLLKVCDVLKDFQITIFCDEIDGLRGTELKAFLTRLRTLYLQAKQKELPQIFSVGLVGMRDIIELTGGDSSPFNIADRINLPNFSLEETANLYNQYTKETNQPFTEEATKLIHKRTDGQPFLVNRLGQISTRDIKPKTVEPITKEDVQKAVNVLLRERNNHFDGLAKKLYDNEEIIARVSFGGTIDRSIFDEKMRFLELCGIFKEITIEEQNYVVIANEIYFELFYNYFVKKIGNQRLIDILHDEHPSEEYLSADGTIQVEKLILDFRRFLVEEGLGMFGAVEGEHEVLGQILFSGFIKHFCERNNIERSLERLSGGGYIDLLLQKDGGNIIIEFMVWDGERYYQQELKKLVFYLNARSEETGYMVIFRYYNPKRRAEIDFYPPKKEEEIDGKRIKVFELYVPRKL